jgi:hypothetical protein
VGVHPPPSPAWANFTLMIERFARKQLLLHCVLCDVDIIPKGRTSTHILSPPQICATNTLRMAVTASAAKFVKVTVTGVFPGAPGPALQFVSVETIVGEFNA